MENCARKIGSPAGDLTSVGSRQSPRHCLPCSCSSSTRPPRRINPHRLSTAITVGRARFTGKSSGTGAAQNSATGHTAHCGERGVQMSAPSSMSAALNSPAPRRGWSASARFHTRAAPAVPSTASRTSNSRATTRAMFASTMGVATSKAKVATAPAVYRPTPGSARSSASARGSSPPCRAITARAAWCKFRARE